MIEAIVQRLAQLRDAMAARHAAGDFQSQQVALTVATREVELLAVNGAADQVRVRWPDGTDEVLGADEIEALGP